MQERTSLEDSLSGIGKVEQELEDDIGMIELGEAEGDDGRRRGGRSRAEEPQEGSRAARARGAAVGRGRRLRFLSRSPCRRRRHREPGLGADAAAHVHALGRDPRLQGRDARRVRGRRGRHQVRDHPGLRPQCLWLAEDRGRRAPPGAHLAVRFQRAAAHLVLVASRSFRSSTTPSRSTSRNPTSASTPCARAAPAASTSTRPNPRCA